VATVLHVQGADIELNEHFNQVRRRLNRAWKLAEDYRNGDFQSGEDDSKEPDPFHVLSFKTVDDDGELGRVSVNLEKIIGVSSTVRTDNEEELVGAEEEEEEEE